MIQISIKIKNNFLGFNFTKTIRRDVPTSWDEIDAKRRLSFINYFITKPRYLAKMLILRDLLNIPHAYFQFIDPADLAQLIEHITVSLDPTDAPIIQSFKHKGTIYHLPLPDFKYGTAYEYATADNYYQAWLDNAENSTALLCLCATLARAYSKAQSRKSKDFRTPLSISSIEAETDIERRADTFKALPIPVIIAILRNFEGIKNKVHLYGLNVGLFKKQRNEKEAAEPDNGNEWWRAFRRIAASLNKTEEAVWQMSLWRVLTIMAEQKEMADSVKK